MNELAHHVWGVSPAADAVWPEVCGLGYAAGERRVLSVWQVYCDESAGDDVFVVGGFAARAAQWAEFTRAWAELLPYGALGPNGYRFKMIEMAANPERLERAQAFWRVIERFVPLGLSTSVRISDIRRAQRRCFVTRNGRVQTVDFKKLANVYSIAFHFLLAEFDSERAALEIVSADEKIELFFDARGEKAEIIRLWDDFNEQNAIGRRYGVPRFVDDEEFHPVQAADMLCWWVREFVEADGKWESLIPWKAKERGKPVVLHGDVTEDQIFEMFKASLEAEFPGLKVYDRNTFV